MISNVKSTFLQPKPAELLLKVMLLRLYSYAFKVIFNYSLNFFNVFSYFL